MDAKGLRKLIDDDILVSNITSLSVLEDRDQNGAQMPWVWGPEYENPDICDARQISLPYAKIGELPPEVFCANQELCIQEVLVRFGDNEALNAGDVWKLRQKFPHVKVLSLMGQKSPGPVLPLHVFDEIEALYLGDTTFRIVNSVDCTISPRTLILSGIEGRYEGSRLNLNSLRQGYFAGATIDKRILHELAKTSEATLYFFDCQFLGVRKSECLKILASQDVRFLKSE